MRMRLRVLDTDGAVVAQPEIAAAIDAGRAARIDLRDLEADTRLWASPTAMERLAARLDDDAGEDRQAPTVNFLGSGDFHHLAVPLIARAPGPLVVVHFDNHPDWVARPPAWHCGSWVNRALALPNVARVVTIGPCAADLAWPDLKGGNRRALAEGRHEVFAWRRDPTWALGRWGSGPGHRQRGRRLIWRNVGGAAWPGFLDELTARLTGAALWLSIDKDVLAPSAAVTNWDQGEMSLDHLTMAIRQLARAGRILGADICGDYSTPRFQSVLKRLAAWADQPRSPRARDPSINRHANQALIAVFSEVLA